MNKKGKLLKILVYLIALMVFGHFEYHLYLKYKADNSVREKNMAITSREIEKSFLIRKDGFYLDKDYIKALEELQEKEKAKDSSNAGGDESLEQHKDL